MIVKYECPKITQAILRALSPLSTSRFLSDSPLEKKSLLRFLAKENERKKSPNFDFPVVNYLSVCFSISFSFAPSGASVETNPHLFIIPALYTSIPISPKKTRIQMTAVIAIGPAPNEITS
jgi:hypothetical protein